jgi:hypothetical protein
VEDDQLPQKSRRLELKESALPGDKAAKSAYFNQAQDVNMELKSLSRVKMLRMNSITNTTFVKTNKSEEMKVLDSPDCVTSSVCDEFLESQEERQKSLTSELDDIAATSTVKTGTTAKEVSSVPNDVAVKFTEAVCSSPVHEVDSLTRDEPQANKPYVNTLPDVFSDTNENKSSTVKGNSACGEKEAELLSCGTEDCAAVVSEEVQEKPSEKEISVNEVAEIGFNVTFTKYPEKAERNDTSARVVNVAEVVDQPNSATEAVPEQQAISQSRPILRSSPTKRMTPLSKSVFRYTLLFY